MTRRCGLKPAMLAALIVATVTIAACSTISVSSMRYLATPTFAPTDPNSVELLRRAPERPHQRLGEVYLRPSGSPDIAEMENAIRVEAAKMGANAAVLVFDKTRRIGTVVEGPWWARSAYPVYGRQVVAVAIRYN